MTRKIVSEMTYNVSMGTLNPTIPYHTKNLLPITGWTAELVTLCQCDAWLRLPSQPYSIAGLLSVLNYTAYDGEDCEQLAQNGNETASGQELNLRPLMIMSLMSWQLSRYSATKWPEDIV